MRAIIDDVLEEVDIAVINYAVWHRGLDLRDLSEAFAGLYLCVSHHTITNLFLALSCTLLSSLLLVQSKTFR